MHFLWYDPNPVGEYNLAAAPCIVNLNTVISVESKKNKEAISVYYDYQQIKSVYFVFFPLQHAIKILTASKTQILPSTIYCIRIL